MWKSCICGISKGNYSSTILCLLLCTLLEILKLLKDSQDKIATSFISFSYEATGKRFRSCSFYENCVCVCIYVCMYIFIYIYICMYIYICICM